jgi:hypothetical protein
MLYEAGVLTGSGAFGAFLPGHAPEPRGGGGDRRARGDTGVQGALQPDCRPERRADFSKVRFPRSFYLERYDSDGALMGIGSGFFHFARRRDCRYELPCDRRRVSAVIVTAVGE